MIFISKMIHDPTKTGVLSQNRMGRTIGLVFYTPKYWDCHKYSFYSNQFDEMRDGVLDEEEMERRYLTKRAHSNCRRTHRSHAGYMYWVGPKRRYTFRYMGSTWHTEVWWKPFSVWKHGDYTRLLDNGSKPPPRPEIAPEREARFQEIMADHNEKFRQALAKAEATMTEYERIRERR